MSENKGYISRADELGNIHIAEEVLAAVAAAAATEVAGVGGLSANLTSDILNKKGQAKGVRLQVEENKVTVELSILMTYGNKIPEVGKAVQENVKTTVESITGLEIAAVNVSVAGVVFPPKQA